MTTKDEAHEAVRTLLAYIEGIDAVNREGLLDTPKRVVESWEEIFAGYAMDASDLLQATFNAEGYEGIVLLRDIEFTSTCEHHLQPFRGRAHIGYIPVDRIVGISKLARILELHARRLQNQERITKGIADDLVREASAPWSGCHHRGIPRMHAVQRRSETASRDDNVCHARRVL